MAEQAADCIVVGGGLIGLLTARELAMAGLRVTVLERNPATGQESSWAGGGILSPLYPWRYPEAVIALVSWSQPRYPELARQLREESGIDPEWQQSGLLILDDDGQGQAWLQARRQDYQLLGSAALERSEPALATRDHGLLLPQAAQVRNPRLLQALRGAATHHGVRIVEGCAVSQVLHHGGQVRGVASGVHHYHAGRVVIAGGAWSTQLLAGLGIELCIAPVRGQMLLYRAAPGLVRHILVEQWRYVIPRRDGHVLVGSTMEQVGFDKSTTTQAHHELSESAAALVPALRNCPLERHWAGLRPGSSSGVPVIGAHPAINGLYINSGHFRNGVVMAPASARLLLQIMDKKQALADPAWYAPLLAGG